MISQSLVAVLIGISIGLLYYIINSNDEEERPHGHGSGGSRTSGPGYPPSRGPSSSRYPDFKEECSICLSEIRGNDLIELKPCSHVFHKACIIQWTRDGPPSVQDSCPNCRIRIRNYDFGLPK